MGWHELFWEKCPAVVPCAMADEHYVLLGARKTCFENSFFQMNPCIKYCFSANQTLTLSLNHPVHVTLLIPPPWVWLDLLSTFVLTPLFIFTEEDPDFVPDDVE